MSIIAPQTVPTGTHDRRPRIRLSELREEAGISAFELAKRSGVAGAVISRVESGERSWKAATLRAIAETLAEALNRPLGDILAELTEPQA